MSDSLKDALLARGVEIPAPDQVTVEDVDPARFEAGACLLPGSRISGKSTVVLEGACIGTEGPAVVRDCALGRGVTLGSGSFSSSVFLDGASFGPSGHARSGTLFEEGASAAHAVGTKQTILFPWATLGSNINACDCLLAGGTSATDHSEIGSGFIHFNFTPFGPIGDKATASLFGDVSRGVWLTERRIFLGGAGGVVGPMRVGYGTVLAAGSVYRRDRGEELLVVGERAPATEMPFDPFVIRRGAARVRRSLEYMAELVALHRWYAEVRVRRAGDDMMQRLVLDAALGLIEGSLQERLKQLERFIDGFEEAAIRIEAQGQVEEAGRMRSVANAFPKVRSVLVDSLRVDAHEVFDKEARATLLDKAMAGPPGHVDWVQGLDDATRSAGRSYLASIVDAYLRDPQGAAALLD